MKRASHYVATAVLAIAALAASAHDGIDHEGPATAAADVSGRPQWLADGTLFVPKSLQRALDLRTAVPSSEKPVRIDLFGEVLPDPESRGSLKAPQAGRLEVSETWPLPGQRVAKDQVLAWLRPVMTQREDAQRRSDLALLQQKLEVARINTDRLRVQVAANNGVEAANNVYYEQAELERQAVERQLLLAQQGLEARVALRAPSDGVVYAAPARAGEVIAAGQSLFEISDSRRLWVSAATFDPALASHTRSARAEVGGRELALQLRGTEPLSGQPGWRLLFEIAEGGTPLVPGQTLPLSVETALADDRRAPTEACVRRASGVTQIWIHVAPERFELRELASCSDAAARVAKGERWVVRGAALLAQYRL